MLDFQFHLAGFVTAAEKIANANRGILPPVKLTVDPNGRRYLRIVCEGIGQRSVHCFVEAETGDILKADGWKKPAKHARGNIFAADFGVGAVGAYGANYLR